MDYEIRRLQLFKELLYLLPDGIDLSTYSNWNNSNQFHPPTLSADFTGERLIRFETQVDKKNLEPKLKEHLQKGIFCGYGIPSNTDGSIEVVLPEGIESSKLEKIPTGVYGFVQGDYSAEETPLGAAESLWLEFLWEEWEPADKYIYLREIPHGNTTVFQLFRQIKEHN